MTNVIDKRAAELNTTFGDLKNGDFFEDDGGAIYIKTDGHTAMVYNGCRSWIPTYHVDTDWFVTPLKVTITIEGEEKND